MGARTRIRPNRPSRPPIYGSGGGRLADGRLLITPSGLRKDELAPSDLLVVGPDGGEVVTGDRSVLVGRVASLVQDTLVLRMPDRADAAQPDDRGGPGRGAPRGEMRRRLNAMDVEALVAHVDDQQLPPGVEVVLNGRHDGAAHRSEDHRCTSSTMPMMV